MEPIKEMTEADKLATILRALLNEYGPNISRMRLGTIRRELWLKARDMLDDRAVPPAA